MILIEARDHYLDVVTKNGCILILIDGAEVPLTRGKPDAAKAAGLI